MNEPKRILILSTGYYPNLVAGAEVAIKEITDRLGGQLAFEMLTLRFDSTLPRTEKVGNITVHRIGFSRPDPTPKELMGFPLYLNKVLFPIMAVIKFRQLDRRVKYDGIWAMMSYMGMTAVLIRMFARPLKFVLTLQEGDNFQYILERKRIRLFVPLIKKAFRDANVIQPISTYLADWAKAMGGKNIVVVPNGVSGDRFKNIDSRFKNEIRKKFGIGENEKVIITTSRLVRKNGVDLLIKAMKYLPPETKLSILGNGPEEAALRELVLENELKDRVHFEGFVPQDKLLPYLSVARVFARPSRSEGQGISFLEAMAARVPVVATAVGGIPDFLEDKKTGLICEPEDPEDLARKINILMRDVEIRNNVIENATRMVVAKYDWGNIVLELKEKVFSLI
ncbi:MAG: glycosyltransferase family 4 protein [Candidatus Taylorbacteria bacterium]|nr:glycosyltransferase family 4 protein [Candidatus Taylorbacteria bacterium]